MKLIKHHWELDVYKQSVEAAMRVFALSKKFPKEEMVNMGNNPGAWILQKTRSS